MFKLEISKPLLESNRGYNYFICVMEMNLNTKLQPLIEDLGRVISGDFLTSTEYKRWMVERDLDELWGN